MNILNLNNGVALPSVGFGVYQSSPADTLSSARAALDFEYRLIDTAAAYGNEAEVGEAMRSGGVAREDVVLQTKLWISDYGYDSALHAFDRSTRKLGFDTIDLYLLHQPMPREFDRTIAAWKAAERLLTDGRARAIGVSNFSPDHLDRLMAETDIVPAVNQIELHPVFVQKRLREAHSRLGILTQAWSPIGGVQRYFGSDKKPEDDPLTHPVIVGIAETHGKTPAQVMLRGQVQLGHSIIPKSVNPTRIAENFDVFDFALDEADRAVIEALDTGRRGGPDPESIDTKSYSFRVED